MGARGPAPQPTRLKVLRGNPGHRPINKREPRPKPIAPNCPTWLDRDAKQEWKRVCGELEELGLLTRIDRAELAAYCSSYSRWKRCEQAIQNYGLTFVTDMGYVQQRPEVAIGNKALAEMRALCVQFGMTPSARSRMTLPSSDDEEDDNPFDV